MRMILKTNGIAKKKINVFDKIDQRGCEGLTAIHTSPLFQCQKRKAHGSKRGNLGKADENNDRDQACQQQKHAGPICGVDQR